MSQMFFRKWSSVHADARNTFFPSKIRKEKKRQGKGEGKWKEKQH